MMRRFATLLLVLCLALSLPVATIAQAAGSSPVKVGEDFVYVELAPVDLEELVSSRGAGTQIDSLDKNGNAQLKDGNYVRYIDRIDIPDYAMTLYETLEEGADGDGTDDILIDVTQGLSLQNSYAVLLAQFKGSYSNEDAIESIIYANMNEAGAYAWAVIGAFDRDHPEVFWLSGSWSITSSFSYGSSTYSQDVYLLLKGTNFDVRHDGYTDPVVLKNAIADRDANVQTILNGLPSTAVTNDAKMRYFNEWLTHNNEYNTAVSSGNSGAAWKMAWECISALQGNSGTKGPVCEGYARAFQVLCMKVGIPCVLVSGDTEDIHTGAKNGHMWNYVQLGGSWYGVDVTWNDPTGGKSGKLSGYERENYLFVGADTVAVTGGRPFLAEHPVENNVFVGDVCFTNGPVLSDTAYDGEHTHTFGAPTFRWAADGKSATAVFTCTEDPTHTMELPAAVTSAVKTDATCEQMGTTTYTAAVTLDGTRYTATKDMQDIPALGHSLTLVPAKGATCTEAGNKAYYVCSGCGKWFEDAKGTVEITNHNSVVIPATGHTPAEAMKEHEIPATCEKDGSYEEVVYCSACGTELSREKKEIPALGHDWGDWVETKAPTDDEKGEETRTCKNDPGHTETREIPERNHVHSLTFVPAQSATCTEAGNKAYYVCNDCGKWFEDAKGTVEITNHNNVVIPATGHTPAKAVKEHEVAATCEKGGSYEEVVYCSACGTELSREKKTVPASGHHLTLVPAKEPTATEEGHSAYYVCSVCGKWFKDAEGKVEITDHNSVVIPKQEPTGLLGDINFDGKVNTTDYMLLKRYVLNTYRLTDKQKAVADINGDGKINSTDYMLLKRYVLGTYKFS